MGWTPKKRLIYSMNQGDIQLRGRTILMTWGRGPREVMKEWRNQTKNLSRDLHTNHEMMLLIIEGNSITIILLLMDKDFTSGTGNPRINFYRFTRRTTWVGSNHLSASSSGHPWFLIHRTPWDPAFPTRASEDSTSDVIQLRVPPTGLANHTTIHMCLQRDPRDLQGLTENFDIDTGRVRKIGLLAEMKEATHIQPKLLDCAFLNSSCLSDC